MLDTTTINSRLAEMRESPAPDISWDETCEGSGRALVVFVGPSPGGKNPGVRRPMNKACFSPHWDESFTGPLSLKSGFRVSFQPLVEALFGLPYATAGKLIARANLDWISDPESKNVAEQFMFEGAPSTLRLLEDCSPEVVLPMGFKAFRILKEVMRKAGFHISDCHVEKFSVRISDRSDRYNRSLHAFFATTRNGRNMLVMKLPQHPARMFSASYATRCGEALRAAATELMKTQTPSDQPALPNAAQVASLLRFLPVFGRATPVHSEWQFEPGVFPWCSLSEAASEFYRVLYDEGFVIPFPWSDWQREGMRYVESPDLVASADLRTLCQLITMHARADRFCEGHFASQLASGHIGAILQRLSVIRDELPSTPI